MAGRYLAGTKPVAGLACVALLAAGCGDLGEPVAVTGRDADDDGPRLPLDAAREKTSPPSYEDASVPSMDALAVEMGQESSLFPIEASTDEAGDAVLCASITDPHDCCGQDCMGGACVSGSCAPLPPDVLATGQDTPGGIVVDANDVYWVNRGLSSNRAQIMRCKKDGCHNTPTEIANGNWPGASKLAVDATNVYWIATGRLYSCSIAGCGSAPTVLWPGQGYLSDIAIDATNVYFSNTTGNQLLACAVGGCNGSPTLLWSSNGVQGNPIGVAVDSTNLYFSVMSGAVFKCAFGMCGSAASVVSSVGRFNQIALDADTIYFNDASPGAAGMILSCAKSGCRNGPTILVSGLSNASGLAADGTAVYFGEAGQSASGGGRVASCAKGGCNNSPKVIAGYVNIPQGVAVDATHVYFTDYGSRSDGTTTDGRVVVKAK